MSSSQKTSEKEIFRLLKKVELFKNKQLDLSSGEDLSIGIMNLISIEEHLFFTSQKTNKTEYLTLLNEVRKIRTKLLKEIIKDYEGEVWCISKHLLAASMRIMEVGTKELKKGNENKAWDLFNMSYSLYSLFWGINTGLIKADKDYPLKENDYRKSEKNEGSFFGKLHKFVEKAVDCCKE